MNAVQTATVLGYLSAAYPSVVVSEQTATVWAEHLRDTDPQVGLAAARQAVRESRFFPSIHEYLDFVRANAPRRTYAELGTGEDMTPADPETRARWLAHCRRITKRVDAL